jgi:CheY-like chemotaxis protein
LAKSLNEKAEISNNAASLKQNPKTENLKKILVVEDNKVNQVVMVSMLKQMGYDLELADDGKQAVQLLSQGKSFDLILMDCQMPVMNGYEATMAIRALGGKFELIPIVALTANAFRETKEECFASGMSDFATKPIKMETLKDVIKKSFDRVNN